MYRVIKYFEDLKDNRHPYNEGDEFPRAGLDVTEARFAELVSNKNAQGTPLIVWEEELEEEAEPEAEEDSLEALNKAELLDLAEAGGFDVPKNATKAEIKAILEESL